MTEFKLDKIIETVGYLKAKMEVLEVNQERAETYRANLMTKVAALSEKLDPVITEVKRLTPIVNDWHEARSKASGFVLALSAIAALAGVFLSEFKAAVIRVFSGH